ncbi:WD-repeat protein JIP5 [Kwoniella heveanensis CBS 569]|nr:WD-repeat protein JIP5 [Kwoniella heveanensis CBS 569]
MPDIKLKNQPFDLAFHPTESIVFSSLLTGEVKAWRYDDDEGSTSSSWTVRPSKRTARTLAVEEGGANVWVGGKSGNLFQLSCANGNITSEREGAHDVPINRVFCVNENLIASGDDDGVIKLWDPRQPEALRSYSQHFDYISDFTYFEDKRQLVSTSGDGYLSVTDIRSNKPQPLSVSDDQEDELLSIAQIKGGTKAVVGSGLGVLSIWNRKQGWGDCVDRIPGHPASVDAIVPLTPDCIATGSEDGMIRVLQVLPHKFLGVIATHEEYPIERIKLDRNGKWLGSVSHDECLKLTDVSDLFEESDDEDMEEDDDAEKDSDEEMEVGQDQEDEDGEEAQEGGEEEDADSDSDEEMMPIKTKKEKKKKNPLGDLGKSRAETQDNGDFFADL